MIILFLFVIVSWDKENCLFNLVIIWVFVCDLNLIKYFDKVMKKNYIELFWCCDCSIRGWIIFSVFSGCKVNLKKFIIFDNIIKI